MKNNNKLLVNFLKNQNGKRDAFLKLKYFFRLNSINNLKSWKQKLLNNDPRKGKEKKRLTEETETFITSPIGSDGVSSRNYQTFF